MLEEKRIKKEKEFIEKSSILHNNFYDYSLVNYVNNKTKVKIICPVHGVFEQRPDNHYHQDCPCCKSNIISVEDFIKKSNKKHNNFYDYSLVDFINIKIPVEIICPVHGVFEQRPECTKDKLSLKFSIIKKFNEKHNCFYDYSKVVYINNKTKIIITCPEHGDFEQTPDSHLRGRGCSSCYGNKKINKEIFVEKSNKVHNNFYNYDYSDVTNVRSKTIIICPEHGDFIQNIKHHMKGHGCPICGLKKSNGEFIIEKILKDSKIPFQKQKKFEECRNGRILPFDFYLPDFNTCIEYDGIQHFEIVDFFGGEAGLIKQQHNDKIKTDFCLKSNINLLRINYTENIENKLEKFLNFF